MAQFSYLKAIARRARSQVAAIAPLRVPRRGWQGVSLGDVAQASIIRAEAAPDSPGATSRADATGVHVHRGETAGLPSVPGRLASMPQPSSVEIESDSRAGAVDPLEAQPGRRAGQEMPSPEERGAARANAGVTADDEMGAEDRTKENPAARAISFEAETQLTTTALGHAGAPRPVRSPAGRETPATIAAESPRLPSPRVAGAGEEVQTARPVSDGDASVAVAAGRTTAVEEAASVLRDDRINEARAPVTRVASSNSTDAPRAGAPPGDSEDRKPSHDDGEIASPAIRSSSENEPFAPSAVATSRRPPPAVAAPSMTPRDTLVSALHSALQWVQQGPSPTPRTAVSHGPPPASAEATRDGSSSAKHRSPEKQGLAAMRDRANDAGFAPTLSPSGAPSPGGALSPSRTTRDEGSSAPVPNRPIQLSPVPVSVPPARAARREGPRTVHIGNIEIEVRPAARPPAAPIQPVPSPRPAISRPFTTALGLRQS